MALNLSCLDNPCEHPGGHYVEKLDERFTIPMHPEDNNVAYQEFLKVHQSLVDAKVPTENRVMYYHLYSWWRHPIKRYRQWRALKKLENI